MESSIEELTGKKKRFLLYVIELEIKMKDEEGEGRKKNLYVVIINTFISLMLFSLE